MADKGQSPAASLGRYQISERLGEGGMCLVFRAQDPSYPFPCALKVLKQELRKDPKMRELFATEADIAGLLSHENLPQCFDAGEINGRLYIAMELFEGGTLGELLTSLNQSQLSLPIDLAIYITIEVLHGLHALHETHAQSGRLLGLIHRDLTPHNIFFSMGGRVVLADFGVAHMQAYGDIDRQAIPGKASYLAPEILDPHADVDHRADIFSAGAVLYEILVGSRAFEGETDEETIDLISEARPTKISKLREEINRSLEQTIHKAMSKKPKDRYATALEFAEALENYYSVNLADQELLSGLLTCTYPKRKGGVEAPPRVVTGTPSP